MVEPSGVREHKLGRRPRSSTRRVGGLILVASVVAVVVTAVSVGLVADASRADEGSVVRVIDGDTVDIRIGGQVERVRLLNVDAPENNKATGESECLGPEASAMLRRLLPEGAMVTLTYDDERRDRYGRLLAGLIDGDGALINAQMAAAGLAGPLIVGDNDRLFAEVADAFEAARKAHVGAFDEEIECTAVAAIADLQDQLSQASPDSLPTEAAALATAAASVAALEQSGDALNGLIASTDWLGPAAVEHLTSEVATLQQQTVALAGRIDKAHSAAVAEEARVAKAAEEARRAQEARDAEEARRAEEARIAEQRAAQQRAAEQSQQSSPPASRPAPPANVPPARDDGGGSKYTGCRNYNGTGMIDSKGRPFAPIPCP